MTKFKTIKHTVHLPASPQRVYDSLMDASKHAEFTGGEAAITAEINGSFEVYDGYAGGTFLELVPGQKIVSTWRELSADWPAEHVSKVTYLLTADGRENTTLQFTQEDVPADRAADLEKGWEDFYWTPLIAYLSAQTLKE